MAREEIIRNLEYTMKKHKNDTVNTFGTNISAMCKDILDYLEQEPCEDCISRQEVINCVTFNEFRYKMVEDIKALPSVTPKEKTGHWESTEIFYGGESKGAIIKCSECGNEFKVSPKFFENLYGNERFCNYCGAKMVE